MSNPPIGNSQIIQLLAMLVYVMYSRATKKNADADPDKTPINEQMRIHCKNKGIFFFMVNEFISAIVSGCFAKVL